MNLTKKDLSAILKKELGLSFDISDSLVDEFFLSIRSTLRSQKNIKSHTKVRFSPTSKAKYFLN